MADTCATCLHYRQLTEVWCCVAHPPQVALIAIPSDGSITVQRFTSFPAPESEWSCAEHRPRLAN